MIGNSGNATGIATVQWNNIPDLNFAVGGATGIYLSFARAIDHMLQITFDAFDGATQSTVAQSFVSGSVGTSFFVPFSTFSNPGVLANVNTFRAKFTSPTDDWDAGIDFMETRDVPVPAPGVLALMTIGLTGLRISGRRAA